MFTSFLLVLSTATGAFAASRLLQQSVQDVYCPDSQGDNTALNGVDFGLNVFKLADTSYAADCYLRYSNLNQPSNSVVQQWIDNSKNVIVFAHGWQPNSDGTHATDEVWSVTQGSSCVSGSNSGTYGSGQTEPCEPTDHDAQYWAANGWNVVYADWKYFAYEPSEVKNAERKLYTDVYNNQNVVELLFDKLNALLNAAGWNGSGKELRLAGHSLGSQVVINLAAKFKQASGNSYKNSIQRIALLDHFFSNYPKDYLPCAWYYWWGSCISNYWTGGYAREVLLPIIRDVNNVPVVIENYRSSPTSSNPFVGDENGGLNEQTVMMEDKPWYYSSTQLAEKHGAAWVKYIHCMKFSGNLHQNAPSCRMSTSYLRNNYCPGTGSSKCLKRFVQQSSSNPGQAFNTWDVDYLYDVYNV